MEFLDNQAIYLHIVEWICERVVSGVWTPGEKLPSVRELAVELEVNPNTVARAYEYSQNEGFMVTRRGIGQYLTDDAKSRCNAYLRRCFVEHEIPRVFRLVELLSISREEWLMLYSTCKKTDKDEKKQ